jgi:hypothetical protein
MTAVSTGLPGFIVDDGPCDAGDNSTVTQNVLRAIAKPFKTNVHVETVVFSIVTDGAFSGWRRARSGTFCRFRLHRHTTSPGAIVPFFGTTMTPLRM